MSLQALIGTQSVVQAKCMSEIVSMLISGEVRHVEDSSAPRSASRCGAPCAVVRLHVICAHVCVCVCQAGAVGTAWLTYVVVAYFVVTVAFWPYRLHDALGKQPTLLRARVDPYPDLAPASAPALAPSLSPNPHLK